MKTFTNLSDLQDYNHYLAEHIQASIDRSDRNEPFMWSLGGDVHVITTLDEALEYIKTNEYFDICEDINDSWTLFVVINNNSGGPTYFIPKDLLQEYNEVAA